VSPLLEIPGVEWVSLHKGHREEEAEAFGLPQPLRSARDFYDTAVVLAGLDMVVSTETAIPNLSAALGVPTCVLTAVDYDWRWRSWFKNVTICNQEVPGNWEGAVAKASAFVRRFLG
jgi:ADP-heptose:LPS heptosyltransferase